MVRIAAAVAALALASSASSGTTPMRLLAAGAYHVCTTDTVDQLVCWGSNSAGELGNGTTTDSIVPVGVKNLTTPIYEVAASYDRTCARNAKGVWCWGRQARVSNGKWVGSTMPVKVGGVPSGAHDLAVGVKHACVLDGSGKPWCWGTNGSGEVGDGTKKVRTKAVKTKFAPAVQIAASDGYTCAIAATGGVQCVGLSHGGDDGDPLNPPGQVVDSKTQPVTIPGLDAAASLSATGDFALALLADGTVMAWGENDHGQLGDGTTIGRSLPLPVPLPGPASSAVATANHACVLLGAGAMCWGRGDHGQLGNGSFVESYTPTAVVGLDGASWLVPAASGHFTLALTTGGSVWGWGRNESGAVGTGGDQPFPVPIAA